MGVALRSFALSVILAIVTNTPVLAGDSKLPVSVTISGGNDTVGQQLAYAVREEIRRSDAYRLADASQAVFHIDLVTLDPGQGQINAGYQTVAAVDFTMANYIPYQKGNPQTWYPFFLSSLVVQVGSQRVEEQARGIVAAFDANVEQYKSNARTP